MTSLNKKNSRQLQSIRKRLDAVTQLVSELSIEVSNLEKTNGNDAGKKPAKDPNAPKRPSTPWIFFYSDQVRPMKSQHPDKSTKEICSLLGQKWQKMTKKQKKKYEDLAAKDRERYATEKEAYDKTLTTGSTTTNKKAKDVDPVDNNDLVLDDDDDFAADDLELSDDGDF